MYDFDDSIAALKKVVSEEGRRMGSAFALGMIEQIARDADEERAAWNLEKIRKICEALDEATREYEGR